MRYHVATNRPIDFEALRRDAEAGKSHRQTLAMLADRLGATFQQPDGGAASAVDRLRCRLVGTPECWAMARRLAAQLDERDVIFCSSEGVGFPIAAASRQRRRARLAIYIHNVDRPRTRAALQVFRLASKVDLFLTNSRAQADFLRSSLRVPESRLLLFDDQTDVQFFTPGPPTPGKRRPVVASVGLEQRDYRTLAEATRDLDVDVRISGFSKDAALQARAFPDDLPANMNRRFYEWPELVQLYRDADVIAVSLFPCRYAAGITTVMEAMSCRRPLVVTRTDGLADIVSPDFARLAQPGDADGIRRAIVDLLADRDAAEAQADRGYELGHHRHDSDRFVATIVDRLATLSFVQPRRDGRGTRTAPGTARPGGPPLRNFRAVAQDPLGKIFDVAYDRPEPTPTAGRPGGRVCSDSDGRSGGCRPRLSVLLRPGQEVAGDRPGIMEDRRDRVGPLNGGGGLAVVLACLGPA